MSISDAAHGFWNVCALFGMTAICVLKTTCKLKTAGSRLPLMQYLA